MSDAQIFRPESAEQLLETMSWLVSEKMPVNLQGRGSKRLIGNPDRSATTLDLSAFTGISLYEPEELVMSAGAATPMAEINKALDQAHQMLAYDPPNFASLLGLADKESGSLGGMIATNLAGPRRIKAGSARDHFLGFQAVSGRGEAFKSGGRVVKNVTGYDLSKLMAGSWGTLGAMHQVTVKTLPRPEKSRTVLVQGVDADEARTIMSAALNSPNEVSAACWLPKSLAERSDVDIFRHLNNSCVALRVEGPGPSVQYRCKILRDRFKSEGKIEELHTSNSARFWREIRDVSPFAAKIDDRVIWKISVAPTAGPAILSQLSNLKNAEGFLDWAGGLVWLAVDAPKMGAESLVRDAVNRHGGHATLIRGPEKLRREISIFHPQPTPLAALSRRLKDNFDPFGLLNPNRMYPGT
ncbi:glycolate oxidase subunit GlcE [Aestuariispira insulae]|uniref:Glycolate oxidase FAD binding subunit n=1 Tax=Aestuariispira insulae TaxID=1461337 RepID=A0A3D9HJN3_9PROT|nr:glycolate oxidase subunit GlcE [Aestuariispira insulae]RED49722.1 glycolate oxidase FAD binding subunit [Aestuariispira insulae]